MRRVSRRHFGQIAVSMAALGALAACGVPASSGDAGSSGGQPPPSQAASGSLLAPTAATGDLTVVLPNSDLAVGPNRFLLALLDRTNRPITDATVRARLFFLGGQQPEPQGDVAFTFRGEGLGDKGLYVGRIDFPKPGAWGLEVLARRGETDLPVARVGFEVAVASQTPAIGAPAIKSHNATRADDLDPKLLCTATPACDMHDLVIADVVGSGKPIVLYFGTPAFCSSRVCGPGLEAVQVLKERFGASAHFIHHEIFRDPSNGTPFPGVLEWSLPSEPWLFLIDRTGKIADKFEGGLTFAEIAPAVERLVS